ncbi:S-layer homology domain-containing protein [Candidatus Peregrinibacteria bacterium]|jgi:hypothetical protein|nr:S-layer homology domain-containing protein [Candidatus Peregrinibacteria bacterium]
MFKKTLSLGVMAALFLMLTGQAFASDSYFGYVKGYIYDTDTEPNTLSITLQDCDDEFIQLDFNETSDLEEWSTKIMDYMYDNQFLNIGADDEVVSVMATMGGDCSIVDILEVYEDSDDLEEGMVLAPVPTLYEDEVVEAVEYEDEVVEATEATFEMGKKFQRRALQKLDKPKVDERAKLKGQLKKMKKERKLTKREIQQFRKKVEKSTKLRNPDDVAMRVKEGTGFEYSNSVKLRELKDESTTVGHPIQIRGKYQAKGDYHVLLNPNLHILATLEVGDEDFSEFLDKRVMVKGTAFRSNKKIQVSDIQLLPENESDKNDALNKWRAGVSLYHDIDTTDESVWYTEYLDLLYDRGVFSGYEDGSFGGANPVTIGEIAKIVAEAAMHELDDDENFEDLDEKHLKHWAKRYLRHMKRYSLLDNLADPDRPATRAEVIKAVLKAYDLNLSDFTSEDLPDVFPDTKDRFIRKAYKLGLISGYPDGTFKPNGQINRAEVAKIITRAIEILEEKNESLGEIESVFEEIEDMTDTELENWLYDSTGDDFYDSAGDDS